MPERGTAVQPYLRMTHPESKGNTRKKNLFFLVGAGTLFNRETLGNLVAVILLTRLRLMGELAPFGLAYWAVAGRGDMRRMVLLGTAALAAAGAAGHPAYVYSLAAAMLFLLLLDRHLARLPYVVAIGMACTVGLIPRFTMSPPHTFDLFLAGLDVSLAMLAAMVFLQVHLHPPSAIHPEKHIEGITSWIVFLGLLLLSLVQQGTFLTRLAIGAARVITLFASFWFGPGLAAATGAMLGFLLGIQGNAIAWLSVLTFAGFLGGLFRAYGRFATAAGFLAGTVMLTLYLTGWESVPSDMAITASAIIFFLLGPVLPVRIQALAPFLKRDVQDEGKQVRDLTAVRIRDYAHVFRELSEAFRQAAALEEREEAAALPSLVEAIAERVCKICGSRRRCWEKDMQRTYNAMLRLLADWDGRKGQDGRVPEFFQKYCLKNDEFIRTLRHIHEMEALERKWKRREAENRELVTMQLAGLSQIMLELSSEVKEGVAEIGRKIKKQSFHLEIGVAQAAKGSADLCGDYYSYLELRDGKQGLILSDGMGNGAKAFEESRSTVQLVEQLLLAGFRKEPIIRTVNTILQLRSRDETFATLDALILDTEKGDAEFLKIGAAPSFLCAEGRVREIKSPSVPLGILADVELKPVRVHLEDDALIVMVTDGIYEACAHRPDWLKNYLAGMALDHPQVLADEIIHQARILSGRPELRDDVTVLVCRVKRLKLKIRDYVAR